MTMTFSVQEVMFMQPVFDPNRHGGRSWLERVLSGPTYRVEYDREFAVVSITHLREGEPHPDSPVVFVPLSNVRSMRIGAREFTTTLAPPAASKKSA